MAVFAPNDPRRMFVGVGAELMASRARARQERVTNTVRIRRAIVAAAHRIFLEEGYDAPLDKVAALADVAPRTIFNVFETKENLFRTVVLTDIIGFEALLAALDVDADIERTLFNFAVGYTDQALSPDALAFHRLLFAERTRFAEPIMGIWRAHFDRLLPPLITFFSTHIATGTLRPIDPAILAENFMVSVMGHARVRTLFDLDPPNAEERRRYIEAVLDQFLRGALA
jgi:TetR/AcrR family transcriptional repressor of mexJK operon